MAYTQGIQLTDPKTGQKVKVWNEQNYKNYLSFGFQESGGLAPVPSGNVPTAPSPTSKENIKTSLSVISSTAKGTYADVERKGGTIYTKTGEAFQTPEQLSKYLGITIAPEWSKIGEKLVSTEAPKFEEPTAGNVVEDYTSSMLANVEKKRTALENERKTQLEETQRKMDETQKKIDEWTAKQEKTLEEAKPLTEPFRGEKEKTERERLKVEENYFENQKLVEELDTLLTDIQAQVTAEKNRTGLASIRNPRIQKAAEEASARVGVIEAVMASRNNQITVANNLIDRSVQAITADRTDQLNYYNTLLDFYSKEKDEEGNKLFALTQQETKFINDNISMLESDLASAQANADYIKGLMLDPATAGIVAKSGVTLNDNPEQVMNKFANFEYSQEVSGQVSEMSTNGYQVLTTPEQIASKDPAFIVRLTDSKGVERVYYNRVKEEESKAELARTKQLAAGGGGAGKGTEAERARAELGISLKDEVEIYANALLNGIEVDVPSELQASVLKRLSEKQKELEAGEITTEEVNAQQEDFFKKYFPTEGLQGTPEEVGARLAPAAKGIIPAYGEVVAGGIGKAIVGAGSFAKGLISGLLK